MSNINAALQKGKALIPFITCGDPDIGVTKQLIYAAEEAGAALIILGIPFSDPTAEAPILQEAAIRALSGGVTTDTVFEMVRGLDVKIPLVFQTYANVVFSYGADKFISACREMGVDGIFVPDLPFAEKEEFLPLCRTYGVALISQAAPAKAERIAEISRGAEGFVYAAAAPGELAALIAEVRKNTDIPCVICADIETPEGKGAIAEADGVIADSAVVRLVAQHGKAAPAAVCEHIKKIKDIL